jgi:hypothetical protein
MGTLSDFYDSFGEGEVLDKTLKWTYWIVGIMIVGAISYILYNKMNKQVAGVLVFMGGMLALYYYYVKWFEADLEPWPPVTSLCPEFMTYVGQDSTNIYCVDQIGVASGMTKYTSGTNASVDTVMTSIKNASTTGTVSIDTAAQSYVLSVPKTAASLPDFCKTTLVSKGITWTLCDSM